MAESRLQRWARKKAEASQEAGAAPSSTDTTPSVDAPGSTAESGPSLEAQELAINEALPEQNVLEKYNLPDPDAIELGTDITGFMRKEIPELLRRRALRALWRSNPVLAVLDGLNDYDEDFSNAATTVNGVQTLYKVGQGMFDKKARAEKQLDEHLVEQDEQVIEQAERAPEKLPEKTPEIAPEEAAEKTDESSELENAVEPSQNTESVTSAADTEPAPRYRPRMRFE
ncbi:DUF3306 domain-containing protein [Marinobacter vulgaris]|uniref:DUF3306 domain-containing protein n=1 Tax=Marinobacter vulgaris TaxID=1928331 RepID=A0A2V3ZLS5_9GAMM|nr:DUF3306 domain-containing protein [Marinobacter vulgaris]PXX92335.1 DUF3306 domain-containing protein [Marinobacter vulgaris]TSJ71722.1 DUF3306 domain-containing protein [Marinobacter vulgaris]